MSFHDSITSIAEYNDGLKDQILDGYYTGILGKLPQPTMFGGKRMRKFVLPASTDYDYPSSLSVGHLGSAQPDILGGSFWDDFGKGMRQPATEAGVMSAGVAGGMYYHPSGAGIFDSFKKGLSSVGHALAPVGKQVFSDVVVPVGKDLLKQKIQDYVKPTTGSGLKPTTAGSRNSKAIAKMIATRSKKFDIERMERPSGNVISYAKKELDQKYKGKKPSDLWNVWKGDGGEEEEAPAPAPKPRGRKPKAPAPAPAPVVEEEVSEEEMEVPAPKPKGKKAKKDHAKGTADIRSFLQGKGVAGGSFLGDIGKVAHAVTPFLPLMMAMGRGEPMPPHPHGGNWASDLGKIGKAVLPFAPLLMGLGRGKMPSKYAMNKAMKGGKWLDDLGKVSKAVAPFAPLLMGLGRGGNWADDLGKVGKVIEPFIPILKGLGAPRRVPKSGGVLIRDDPSQFQVSTGLMPPALASYNPPTPPVSGSGRKKSASPRKPSERGAIVSKIMKEKGLSLPQASKYVKEHGLY